MDYSLDPDDAPEMFPSFKWKTQKKLFQFLVSVEKIATFFDYSSRYTNIFGILFTIVHIVILSKKEMRSSSVNIILIGLGIVDIFLMFNIYRDLYIDEIGYLEPTCTNLRTYFKIYFEVYTMAEWSFLYRCKLWFIFLMALVRAVAIKNVMNPNYNFWSKSKFGWYLILLFAILSCLLSSPTFFAYKTATFTVDEYPFDETDPNCPPNVTEVVDYYSTDLLESLFTFNGISSNIVICIAFPIVTAVLVIEVRKASASRKRLSSSKEANQSNRTTILVTFIAASFMIIELPQGIRVIIDFYYDKDSGINFITLCLAVIIAQVGFLNCLTRGPVCYLMSSQYRSTANELLTCKCFKRRRKVTTSLSKVSSLTVANTKTD